MQTEVRYKFFIYAASAIPKNKAEELVEIIRNGIDRDREDEERGDFTFIEAREL